MYIVSFSLDDPQLESFIVKEAELSTINQVNLKILNILFFTINDYYTILYYRYFRFHISHFLLSLYRALRLKEIKIVWKWSQSSSHLKIYNVHDCINRHIKLSKLWKITWCHASESAQRSKWKITIGPRSLINVKILISIIIFFQYLRSHFSQKFLFWLLEKQS